MCCVHVADAWSLSCVECTWICPRFGPQRIGFGLMQSFDVFRLLRFVEVSLCKGMHCTLEGDPWQCSGRIGCGGSLVPIFYSPRCFRWHVWQHFTRMLLSDAWDFCRWNGVALFFCCYILCMLFSTTGVKSEDGGSLARCPARGFSAILLHRFMACTVSEMNRWNLLKMCGRFL